MSAPSSGTRPPSFDIHPLVSKLHPDPDAITNYQILVGYFGPSKEEGHIRLYTDLTFRGYFDISQADIVSTQAANLQDENSPTVVFVKSDGKVELIQNPGANADLLKGAISSANLASAANAGCIVGTMTMLCTIGANLAPAQHQNAACCGTLWTAGCTFPSNAAPQGPNAVGCVVGTMTMLCTIGANGAPAQHQNAACCGTLWTAGCTFPSNAVPQGAPVNTCIQVLMTTMCTVGNNVAPTQGPNVGCCGTFWTAGCTFPSNA